VVKTQIAGKKPSDSEFCELATSSMAGVGKSFENLGGVALPSFTHPPN
jgi:hypothetical protein